MKNNKKEITNVFLIVQLILSIFAVVFLIISIFEPSFYYALFGLFLFVSGLIGVINGRI